MSTPVQFDISNYPEKPEEYDKFFKAKNDNEKQAAIDSLMNKINSLQSIRQQFEKFICP